VTPEQYERVRSVFLVAQEKTGEQRAAFLDDTCGGDELIRREVVTLLASDERADTFLETPALETGFAVDDPAPIASDVGTQARHPCHNSGDTASPDTARHLDRTNAHAQRDHPEYLGQYKVLGVLGAGGMGVVYHAEQERPRRTVALKVIKPGVESHEALIRFEQEGHVLGRLQHPGIAQIFEVGTADAGRGPQPFFAMEFVRGVSLTDYAQVGRLGIRARLELVAKVCGAVRHAHQKGVIHRDLKPGNILVDATGQPKILDFGVARATDADVRTITLHTAVGQLVGTIAYMSPEQIEADPGNLDSRSDVFSLGVICYELLTGHLPVDISAKTIAQAARAIVEQEPVSLCSINRVFRGDIETIVAKALEKDRDRRYQSASDFADDIHRYLSDLPIAARPVTTMYQLRKFARRNKPLVAGVFVAFASLVIGIVGTTSQAIRATQERNRALNAERVAERRRLEAEDQRANAEREYAVSNAVVDFVRYDLLSAASPWRTPDREMTVREVLNAASESVQGRFEGKPLVEASVRQVLGDAYFSLGLWDSAETHLEEALRLYRGEAGEENPHTLKAMNRMGLLCLRQGRHDEAESLLVRTLELRRRVLGKEHKHTLLSMNHLAWAYRERGRYKEAEKLWGETLEAWDRAPTMVEESRLSVVGNLADLYVIQDRYDEAEPLYIEALEVGRRVLGPEYPSVLSTMNGLAYLYDRQGRRDEAEALFLETLDLRRRVLGEEHPRTLATMNGLAILYKSQGRFDKAEPLCLRTLEIKRRVLGEEHPHTLNSMNNLANVYSVQGLYDKSEPLYVKTLEARRRVLGEDHPRTLSSTANLGDLYSIQGRFDEAEPLYRRALAGFRQALGPDHARTLSVQRGLVKALIALEKFEEAEPIAVDAYQRNLDDSGPADVKTQDAIELVADLHRAGGNDDQSAAWRAKLLTTRPVPSEQGP